MIDNDPEPGAARSAHSVNHLLDDTTIVISDSSSALLTGFHPLDQMIGGLHPEELVILAGRPGVGKTIIMFQWARTIAKAGGHAIYASFEHGSDAMLARLLMLELGDDSARNGNDLPVGVYEAQACVQAGPNASKNPAITKAFERMRAYGDKLQIIHCAPNVDDFGRLLDLVRDTPEPKVLFIDYLQKLEVKVGVSEELKAQAAAEALKELAVTSRLPVVAAAAVNEEGLRSSRVRARHIRGAAAIAHEADVVMLLNDKLSVISQVHVAYDSTLLDNLANQVVLTIEKNRGGPAGLDLQFQKQFSHSMLNPEGSFVQENLVDEVLYRE